MHGLKLQTFRQWRDWLSDKRPDLPPRPWNLPASPWVTYRGEWTTWAAWLRVTPRVWRPFAQAREFSHGLNLHTHHEWLAWVHGNRPDLPPRPSDIPAQPRHAKAYRKLWNGWRDWLGVKSWRAFALAREFAHGLNLRTYREWLAWVRGERSDLPARPSDIPAYPDRTPAYREFWNGWPDWLGVQRKSSRIFPFAREFAHGLELKTMREWKAWVRGERPDLPARPSDIPTRPDRTPAYREFWEGWPDWLGYPRWRHRI
jgi:hypothetical protein